jgi:hypothetical protein
MGGAVSMRRWVERRFVCMEVLVALHIGLVQSINFISNQLMVV